MTLSIKIETGRSGQVLSASGESVTGGISQNLEETRRGIKATKQQRDRFLERRLGIVETVIFRFAPRVLERLVPDLREYRVFEELTGKQRELEKQVAEEQKAAEKEARAVRAALFAQPIAPNIPAPLYVPKQFGGELIEVGLEERKRKQVTNPAVVNDEIPKNPQRTADSIEIEQQFPFKVVTLRKKMERQRWQNFIVDDKDLIAKDTAKWRERFSDKSAKKAETFDLMVRHLKRTAGMSYLAEDSSYMAAGKRRIKETVGVGYKTYPVRSLKPNGIEGNPLAGLESKHVRIKYIFIPELSAVAIVDVINNRSRA